MILQDRDQKILGLAKEHHFLTLEQIQPLFREGSKCESARRIRELSRAGYFYKERSLRLGRKPLFRLTSKGAQRANEVSPFEIKPRRFLNHATLEHDAIVTGARVILERHFQGSLFTPEEALKAEERSQIPDGIFTFRTKRAVALEIENSEKWSTRFLKIHERWDQEPNIFLVLFVATTPAIETRLKHLIPQIKSRQPFGVILWDDLKDGKEDVWCPKKTRTLAQLKERLECIE